MTRTPARPAAAGTAPGPRTHILGTALLVAAGSAVGTLARAGIGAALPAGAGQWPWATFGVNVLGSLLLGALLEALSRSGGDTGWRRRVRLGAGTGVLGGFTTYSTYVIEVGRLADSGHPSVAAAYAVASVAAGVAAAGVGVAGAAAVARRAGRGR
ncbi:CrcB family protein [Nocardiopsis sp. NPDC006139]|uniref:fluoride efflux transporter FluC n=1 Tax=Nocardiopsis TaxID=2013 RepID=UPI0033A0B7C0